MDNTHIKNILLPQIELLNEEGKFFRQMFNNDEHYYHTLSNQSDYILPQKLSKHIGGELAHLPEVFVKSMLYNQHCQTGKIDINIFCRDVDAQHYDKGFSWSSSIEGYEFWRQIMDFRYASDTYRKDVLKKSIIRGMNAVIEIENRLFVCMYDFKYRFHIVPDQVTLVDIENYSNFIVDGPENVEHHINAADNIDTLNALYYIFVRNNE